MKRKNLIIISSISIALIAFVIIILMYARHGRVLQKDSFETGRTIWHGDPAKPLIALTFDDGPSEKYTPQVLDLLKKYDIKATFFVIGMNIKTNKDIIKRMDKEGHTIANHTYYHLNGKTVKKERIRKNFLWTSYLIYNDTGKRMTYFRPPFGYENWRFLREAEKFGYQTILWSVDAGDWNGGQTKDDIVKRITDNTENGSIILLHDGGTSREAVIEALPEIIVRLKKNGYKFVSLPELLKN